MTGNAFTNTAKHDDGLPGSRSRYGDFVAVDDNGDFTYYPSEAAVLDDFEYVAEAASIFDRAGNDYRLTLEDGRTLRIGAPLGRVEFTWLREAWMNDRHRETRHHRLLRFYPKVLEPLVAGIFETLCLELAGEDTQAIQQTQVPWTVETNGHVSHLKTLTDVDGLVGSLGEPRKATVRDPFGHLYRPAPRPRRLLRRHGGRAIYYVEIEQQPQGPAATKP
ncbi:hypothetical protein [Arthrobacter sp. NyZ413]|uniref:hypothetical protein n=1 Tax=Arthrobacter sp. NyZ413 TaxID=3144669 RepID=UPI003BF8375E